MFSKIIFTGCLTLGPWFASLSLAQSDTTNPSQPEQLIVESEFEGTAKLRWIGSGDDQWDGKASGYYIRKSAMVINTEIQWQQAVEVDFKIISGAEEKRVEAMTTSLKQGEKGYLTIRSYDDAGNLSALGTSFAYEIIDPFAVIDDKITKNLSEAASIGHEPDGAPLWGCVALVGKDLIPGKYGRHIGACNIALNGKEISEPFYRFVTADSVTWQSASTGNIPEEIDPYGSQNGSDLFICRGNIFNGLHPGFLSADGICMIPWGGVVQTLNAFEVLIN